MEAPYVREEQPLGEIMQDRVVDLFGMQQAAKERRQAMFRTLAATARLQSQLGKSSPMTPPKAAPKVLVDQLGKSSPTTPPKAAPKVLSVSSDGGGSYSGGGGSYSGCGERRNGRGDGICISIRSPVWDKSVVSGCGTRAASFTCNGPRRGERGRSHSKGSEVRCEASPRGLGGRTREVGCAGTTDGVPHAVLRFGGRSFGVSGSTTGSGVHPTGQCGEEHGNGEAVGSSNGASSSGTRPSSNVLTSTTSRPNSDATRSFSAVPAYVDYAVPGSNGGGATYKEAGPHDGQLDRAGRGTKAGSHGGTEGVFYYGANGGSYNSTAAFADGGSYNSTAYANGGSNDGTATLFDDGTAIFFDDGTAAFSKDGVVACYSNVAKAFDIDDPSGTTRGAEREPVDSVWDCSDASVGCIWAAAYANDGSPDATGGHGYADTRRDNGSQDVAFDQGDPLSEARGCYQQDATGCP